MQVVSWEDTGWHVQLRNDGDAETDPLIVRIATSADVEGDDAAWIPLSVFNVLSEKIKEAVELVQ